MGNAPSYAKIATLRWYREGTREYGKDGFQHNVVQPATIFRQSAVDDQDKVGSKGCCTGAKTDGADAAKRLPELVALAPPDVTGAWSARAPPMAKRLVLVTGANQGIGFASAMGCARLGAHVVLLCRNVEKGAKAADEMRVDEQVQTAKGEIDVVKLDVSDFVDVLRFGEDAHLKNVTGGRTIDVLVNNAGCMTKEREHAPNSEHDSIVATALGGAVLLSGVLLPHMTPSTGRIINVASGGQYAVAPRPNDLDLSDLKDKNYDGTLVYAYAKRWVVQLTRVMAHEWPQVGVFSMHPGWTETEGVKQSMPTFAEKHKGTLRTPDEGADTIVWLAAATPEVLQAAQEFSGNDPATDDALPSETTANAEHKLPSLPGSGSFFFDRRIVAYDMSWGGTAWTAAQREQLWKEAKTYVGL